MEHRGMNTLGLDQAPKRGTDGTVAVSGVMGSQKRVMTAMLAQSIMAKS
jgi:hypothetical protein